MLPALSPESPCVGCPASLCRPRESSGIAHSAQHRVSTGALTRIAASLFGLPLVLLCLLAPLWSLFAPGLQALCIIGVLLCCALLLRALAPWLERSVGPSPNETNPMRSH